MKRTGLKKLLHAGRPGPADAQPPEPVERVGDGDENRAKSDADRALVAGIEAFEQAQRAWLMAATAHQDAARAHRRTAELARARADTVPGDRPPGAGVDEDLGR